jgi:hypothetical protein
MYKPKFRMAAEFKADRYKQNRIEELLNGREKVDGASVMYYTIAEW